MSDTQRTLSWWKRQATIALRAYYDADYRGRPLHDNPQSNSSLVLVAPIHWGPPPPRDTYVSPTYDLVEHLVTGALYYWTDVAMHQPLVLKVEDAARLAKGVEPFSTSEKKLNHLLVYAEGRAPRVMLASYIRLTPGWPGTAPGAEQIMRDMGVSAVWMDLGRTIRFAWYGTDALANCVFRYVPESGGSDLATKDTVKIDPKEGSGG